MSDLRYLHNEAEAVCGTRSGRGKTPPNMMTAAAALAMAKQHRTPEDDAVSRITKEVSDLISQVSVEGGFHVEYILPAVLSGVPSYDIRLVHSRIIKGLRRAGYRLTINGPQVVINWNKPEKEENDDEQIKVVYSKNTQKRIPKKRKPKKSVKFS